MSTVTTESSRPPASMSAAGRPDLHIETTCKGCGATVTKVRDLRNPSEWVVLDGRDPDGGWWAAKDTVSGHWRVMRPLSGEDPPATNVRYREHACAVGERAERHLSVALGSVPVAPAVMSDPAVGWCAGSCGAMCRVYGPAAEILCEDCRGVLEAWRRLPGPHRGSIPYGKVVDGAYRHPEG